MNQVEKELALMAQIAAALRQSQDPKEAAIAATKRAAEMQAAIGDTSDALRLLSAAGPSHDDLVSAVQDSASYLSRAASSAMMAKFNAECPDFGWGFAASDIASNISMSVYFAELERMLAIIAK
jgi:hypothetical protein